MLWTHAYIIQCHDIRLDVIEEGRDFGHQVFDLGDDWRQFDELPNGFVYAFPDPP